LQLRGFEVGQGRQPLSSEQRLDLSLLSDTLQCLLAEEGFTDQPVGGCPVGDTTAGKNPAGNRAGGNHSGGSTTAATDPTAPIEPQLSDVRNITQGVLAELRRRGIT
jgi:hypothetical protein